MRIFPEMWASTLCPFSSSTRNMAFGSGSMTVPSRTIASSLGLGRTDPPVKSPKGGNRLHAHGVKRRLSRQNMVEQRSPPIKGRRTVGPGVDRILSPAGPRAADSVTGRHPQAQPSSSPQSSATLTFTVAHDVVDAGRT